MFILKTTNKQPKKKTTGNITKKNRKQYANLLRFDNI